MTSAERKHFARWHFQKLPSIGLLDAVRHDTWQVGPQPALTFRVQTLAQLSVAPLWRLSAPRGWHCSPAPPPMWAPKRIPRVAEYSTRILIGVLGIKQY